MWEGHLCLADMPKSSFAKNEAKREHLGGSVS